MASRCLTSSLCRHRLIWLSQQRAPYSSTHILNGSTPSALHNSSRPLCGRPAAVSTHNPPLLGKVRRSTSIPRSCFSISPSPRGWEISNRTGRPGAMAASLRCSAGAGGDQGRKRGVVMNVSGAQERGFRVSTAAQLGARRNVR